MLHIHQPKLFDVLKLLSSVAWFGAVVAITATAQEQVGYEATRSGKIKDERFSRNSPDGTLRVFTLGVMLGDERLLRLTTIPESEEDFRYLLKDPNVTQLNLNVPELKESCAKLKVRVLKPGDSIVLPGNEAIVISDKEVTNDRMVILLENSPIPYRLCKTKGYWWVDARPLIAARKMASNRPVQK